MDGQDAVDKAASEHPDVVILDVLMPRMGGLDACRAIKKNARPGELLPILLVSSKSEPAARVEGLRAGAEDFLGKPFDSDELRARVEVLLRTKRCVAELVRQRIGASSDDGSAQDTLTGLYNQRWLTQRLDEEFQRAARYNEPLSLMAVDLDAFEAVNGRYGRGVGDRMLEAVGKTLVKCCRQVDIVTRAGGDEFIILLPNTHFSSSVLVAERIWREVRQTGIDAGPAGRVACEASVGVASYPSKDIGSPKDLLRFAHAALARAKAEGRSKICLYQYQGYLFQPQ
jgi:diguanylate cyclase (GGDEF)-like protein